VAVKTSAMTAVAQAYVVLTYSGLVLVAGVTVGAPSEVLFVLAVLAAAAVAIAVEASEASLVFVE